MSARLCCLRSNSIIIIVNFKGITQTAEHHHQLIKRMEPIAEENRKLKEAMKLLEKNTQRSRRERDLAESNALDLEHQKGVLSEQLATTKE